MQEEMIDNGDCVGTASGAVFRSEHNVGICLVHRSYNCKSVLHRPSHNHMVFAFLNWLSWIMLSAPSCFFTVKSGVRSPVR